jgi:hypothetical protein
MAAAFDRTAALEGPGFTLERASWGALFAGLFVGTGTLFLLLAFGAAVGFTAVDPRNFDSWKNAGIGIGIWGGISAIVASFFSAWVTARLSGAWTRLGGALHGIALWGLSWAMTMWLGAMLVGGVVRGAAGAAGTAAESAAQSGELSRGDVQQGGTALQQQADRAKQQLGERAGEVSQAAEAAGKTGAWGAFLAALFTLLASAVGGAAGVAKRHVVVEREPAAAHRPLTTNPTRP